MNSTIECEQFAFKLPCSGHGYCNDAGVCVCDPGYSGLDNFGYWPQDCQVNIAAQRGMIYADFANVGLLFIFLIYKCSRIVGSYPIGLSMVRTHAVSLITVALAFTAIFFEVFGYYVGNGPNAVGILLSLALGGFYVNVLEFGMLYLRVLKETNAIRLSRESNAIAKLVAIALQSFSVAGNVVLLVLLNAYNGGHPSVYQIDTLCMCVAAFFGFNAASTAIMLIFELSSIRAYLLQYHNEAGISHTSNDRAIIISKVTTLLAASIVSLVVSPVSAIIVLALPVTRRYFYCLEFILVQGMAVLGWIAFGYVLSDFAPKKTVEFDDTEFNQKKRSQHIESRASMTRENLVEIMTGRPSIDVERRSSNFKAEPKDPALLPRSDSQSTTTQRDSSGDSKSPTRTTSGASLPRTNSRGSMKAKDHLEEPTSPIPTGRASTDGKSRSDSTASHQHYHEHTDSNASRVTPRSRRESEFTAGTPGAGVMTERPRSIVSVAEEEIPSLPPAARLFATEELAYQNFIVDDSGKLYPD